MTKASLRKLLIASRKENFCFENSFKKEISKRFLSLSEFRKCDTLLTYVSSDFEMDTREIIRFSISIGKKVYSPKVIGKDMIFYRIRNLDELTLGRYNILEPYAEEMYVPTGKALCILPCLAINRHGYRLGYGGGYYDRFLKVNGNNMFKSALCLEKNITDFEQDDWDIAADAAVTEKRFLYFNSSL